MKRQLFYGKEDDSSILYQGNNLILDGVSKYIDTGITLFDTNKDFTVLLVYTSNNISGSYTTIFENIIDKLPYYGIVLDQPENDHNFGRAVCGRMGVNAIPHNKTMYNTKHCCVLMKKGLNIKLFTDDKYPDGIQFDNMTPFIYNKTVLLGAHRFIDDKIGRFWKGVIHFCNIYSVSFSDSYIKDLMNRYMEK